MTISQPLSRRQLTRLLAGGSLALIGGGLLTAQPASAGISWCRMDPHVAINGVQLQVFPERDMNAPNTCTGPIKLVFSVPVGATTAVLSADSGFDYGYDIVFQESTKLPLGQYQVDMYVPASTRMAVRLVCDPVDPSAKTTIKSGYANTWISVITKI